MFKHTFYYKTDILQPLETIWPFFQTNENLAAITGFPKIKVLGDKEVFKGSAVHLQLNFFIVKLNWKGEITETADRKYFIDEGLKIPFPFKSWRHVHAFKRLEGNGTRMIDRVEYTSFLPPFIVNLMLKGMFADRKRQLKKMFGSF
ncbi:SRPBCC family protein [Salipaludibacillus aurantiacus]|uniref:Ligand-binding SRPBCC domain-containing protein n=1 Tax=Salipaludibacillus aurantiacus TaxID=1601833 RepID=A0A1H9PHT8_9BACI|nr:hypothetical protein [Salipaludibacillus aurantiacus]SER47781.1 hypothetical protein SAMN05518684_101324 [Salipaludibacillus aurantiacus]